MTDRHWTLKILDAPEWGVSMAQELSSRLRLNPSLRISLPTGSTPRPFYRSLIGQVDLSQSQLFLLDEFGLPPGDPARCDSMIQRDLMSHLPSPPPAIEALNPDTRDHDAECQRYRRAVVDGGLDLAIVGIGSNGHVGLNEPGSGPDSITRKVSLNPSTQAVLHQYGATAGTTWGLTTGISELVAAREVWLLATGSHKQQILNQALYGPIGPDLPASFLRNCDRLVVWADRAAVGE